MGRSRWMVRACLAAVTVVAAVASVAPVGAGTSVYASGSSGSQAFVVDGVSVTVAAPFALAPFTSADPASVTQAASSAWLHPFTEVALISVPFGTTPNAAPLPVAASGAAPAYRQALARFRTSQGATQTAPAPAARIFGSQVTGRESRVMLPYDGPADVPVDIGDWVTEAGSRIWILVVSRESTAGSGLADLSGMRVSSPRVGAPSAMLSARARPAGASPAAAPPRASDALDAGGNLPYPSWWTTGSGSCTSAGPAGTAPLSSQASYLGMDACGPIPGTCPNGEVGSCSSVPDAGWWGWQCVELSTRYLRLAYGLGVVGGNGNSLAHNYANRYPNVLSWVANGTVGTLPQAGDVVQESGGLAGHTYVITGTSNVNGGSETVSLLEQNSTPSGVRTETVSTWSLSDRYTGYTVDGWAHGAPLAPPPPPTGPLTQFVANNGWAAYNVTSASGGPNIAGRPMYDGSSVWARGASGDLYQFVPPFGSTGWGAYDITTAAGGPSIAGDPMSAGGSVWAQASNGHLEQFVPPSGSTGWGAYDITAAANGPSITGDPMYAGSSVWAQGTNGHLYQFVAPSGSNGWAAYDVTASSGGPSITGSPMYDGSSVWARAANGHLEQFVPPFGSTGWGAYDITTASSGPSITGDPMSAGGSVWAQASNGHLIQFVPPFGSTGWGAFDITTTSGGPSIAGDPMYAGGSVWARASSGHLYQFVPPSGSSGWGAFDVTTSANGPSIAGDPVFSGSSAWAMSA